MPDQCKERLSLCVISPYFNYVLFTVTLGLVFWHVSKLSVVGPKELKTILFFRLFVHMLKLNQCDVKCYMKWPNVYCAEVFVRFKPPIVSCLCVTKLKPCHCRRSRWLWSVLSKSHSSLTPTFYLCVVAL